MRLCWIGINNLKDVVSRIVRNRSSLESYPAMSENLSRPLGDTQVKIDRIVHIVQRAVERERLSEARPRENRQTKEPQTTYPQHDPYSLLHPDVFFKNIISLIISIPSPIVGKGKGEWGNLLSVISVSPGLTGEMFKQSG